MEDMEVTPLIEELNSILGRNVRKGMHKQPAASNGRVVTVGYSLESGYSHSKFERSVLEVAEGYPEIVQSVSFEKNDGYWVEAVIQIKNATITAT